MAKASRMKADKNTKNHSKYWDMNLRNLNPISLSSKFSTYNNLGFRQSPFPFLLLCPKICFLKAFLRQQYNMSSVTIGVQFELDV